MAAASFALAWDRLPAAGAALVALGAAGIYVCLVGVVARRSVARLVSVSVTSLIIAVAAVSVLGIEGPAPVAGHPAGPGASRTWVSGVGDDVNPCSRTAPCKTFSGAISKTAAGGEINVLDPAGYGAVTITKSITISAEGVEAGVLVSGTNGIIVNAGPTDVVVLRGLDIEGLGTGLNGIRFLNGAALHVENTTINNFAQKGIDFEPANGADLYVTDTTIRHTDVATNGGGIFATSASNPANVELDNVRLVQSLYGLKAGPRAQVSITDSVASGNGTQGVVADSTTQPAFIHVEDSLLSDNAAGARAVGTAATVQLSGNMIADNGNGISTASGGTAISFGNNAFSGNGSDGTFQQTIALK